MGKLADRSATATPDGRPWTLQDAADTYSIQNWGKGYFGINSWGNVVVHPTKDPAQSIDIKDLIDRLQDRGIQLPILLRFTDILRHRIGEMADSFNRAIAEYGYQNK
ncbi:MAG TPA: hypothetical protein VG817_01365, partial [Gemmatimonadales bacterium]|nr:hypothetical protein [Gemmatimonadales bacterium]